MEITGQLTRQRALIGAGVLLVALFAGGKLLLGSGAASPPVRVAGPPAGTGAHSAGRAAAAAPGPGPPAGGHSAGVATVGGRAVLVVHVVGAVRRPGLYRLPKGARAADAVSRAGGATTNADLEAIDLAAPIADGQQVAVLAPAWVRST